MKIICAVLGRLFIERVQKRKLLHAQIEDVENKTEQTLPEELLSCSADVRNRRGKVQIPYLGPHRRVGDAPCIPS